MKVDDTMVSPGSTSAPARGEDPVFGGHEIGIGFAGTCDVQGGVLEGTAFAGKRGIRFEARLKLICAA